MLFPYRLFVFMSYNLFIVYGIRIIINHILKSVFLRWCLRESVIKESKEFLWIAGERI